MGTFGYASDERQGIIAQIIHTRFVVNVWASFVMAKPCKRAALKSFDNLFSRRHHIASIRSRHRHRHHSTYE